MKITRDKERMILELNFFLELDFYYVNSSYVLRNFVVSYMNIFYDKYNYVYYEL